MYITSQCSTSVIMTLYVTGLMKPHPALKPHHLHLVDNLKDVFKSKKLPKLFCGRMKHAIKIEIVYFQMHCFFHLSKEEQVTIEQKYLTKGHTQMECDGDHSTIETKLKNTRHFLTQPVLYYNKRSMEKTVSKYS